MAKQTARPGPQSGAPHPEKKAGGWMTKWGQILLSAMGGAVLTLVTIVLAFAQVKNDAAANTESRKEHERRIDALELTGAAEAEWRKGLDRRLESIDKSLEKLAQ